VTVRGFFYAPSGVLRAVWRIVGFLIVCAAATYLCGAVLRRIWPGGSMLWRYSFGFAPLLCGALIAHAVMLVLVDRRPWSSVGLGAAQARPALLAGGAALGALGILAPSGVLLASHWLSVGAPVLAGASWGGDAMAFAAFFLPAALSEELVSRGYMFAAIREGAGPVWAIAISSVFFAGAHWFNPGANAQSFTLVLLAGIWLGLVVVITGSLWAATAAHFAWNWAMAALLHAPVSGILFPEAGYSVLDSGPDWATGGRWGPEGGAGAALGMIAGMAALVVWQRRRGARFMELANG
jgi:membrane protease YdiL (CAAX protease family)